MTNTRSAPKGGAGARGLGRRAGAAGRRAARNPWLLRLARVGLAAKGLLFLIIGYLAVRIATGTGGGEQADNSGALQVIAQNTGGAIVLWAAAAGMGGLAVWQATVAVLGGRFGAQEPHRRAAAGGRAVVYAVLCGTIVHYLLGTGAPQSQDAQSETLTAQLMALPAGRFIVGAVGLGMIGVGLGQGWRGISRRFEWDLDLSGASRAARRTVRVLGVVGNVTFCVVMSAAGLFIGQAALTYDTDRAQGLDGTLRLFAETPAGPPLLFAVAVGVILYGLYCFCESRYVKG
ncbi:DUF1206 domain-containing protein [Nocardiopsis trehalosi]|jgi:hypothetical protein|uniref:DUF1206 domain-containing protein n=1 Tax=Nocardiopsis trehalosi TaxID=109329 RepID=UPI000A06F870|nr:DUF1206 domain-containing protein [Nocardiopsis trehalosi]